jgi:hypothetical protein
MAFIVEQYVGDRGIQIGVEDVIRPFSFGTNWEKIRIGIRYAANGYTDLPTSTFGIRLGICTGYAGTLSGTTTDCIFAVNWGSAQGGTISGTAPLRYYGASFSPASVLMWQRVGSTTTSFGTMSTTTPSFSANPTALRSMMMVDITKGTIGAAAIAATSYQMTAVQVVSDKTRGDFLAAMETEVSPAGVTGVNLSSPNLPTRFVKDWDSMVVAWPRSTPTVCVYDMTVVRFI